MKNNRSAAVFRNATMIALVCAGCSSESSSLDARSDGEPDIVTDAKPSEDKTEQDARPDIVTRPGCVRPTDAVMDPEVERIVVVAGRCAVGQVAMAMACEESPALLTVASKQDYDAVFALDCKQSGPSPDFSKERVAFFLTKDVAVVPKWVFSTTDRMVIGTAEDPSIETPESGLLIGFTLPASQRPVHLRRCPAHCK